jgi:hypothetical protein
MPRKTTRPTFYRDKECPTCHCFFTSQGLAGHLRFAHGNKYGEGDSGDTVLDSIKLKAQVEARCTLAGLSSEISDKGLQLVSEWARLQMYGELLGVRFTQQDLKHFLMAKMAQEH